MKVTFAAVLMLLFSVSCANKMGHDKEHSHVTSDKMDHGHDDAHHGHHDHKAHHPDHEEELKKKK